MSPLARDPHEAYRRVALDARIAASDGRDLTLICIEQAVEAIGQAMLALERAPAAVPAAPLARAHGIALWLARTVASDSPLHGAMTDFYGGLAAVLAQNLHEPDIVQLGQAREDFADLLAAVRPA